MELLLNEIPENFLSVIRSMELLLTLRYLVLTVFTLVKRALRYQQFEITGVEM